MLMDIFSINLENFIIFVLVEILRALEQGKKRSALAIEYNCDVSVISRMVKRKGEILEIFYKNGGSTKRVRNSEFPVLEKCLSIWFKDMRNKNTLINGAILSEKANLFAKMLDIPNFTANNGWLGRWKKKNKT